MNALLAIAVLIGVIIGIVTAIVSWRVLRQELKIASPLLGIGVGALSALGLLTHGGGTMSAILIPYEALGIAVVLILLLLPFLKHKKARREKPPPEEEPPHHRKAEEDPWEKELRQRARLAA